MIELSTYQGDTWELSLIFQNPDGTVMDISDETILFYLRRNKKTVYDKDSDEITIDESGTENGELKITINSDGMSSLSDFYKFVVKFEEDEEVVHTQLVGNLKVLEV